MLCVCFVVVECKGRAKDLFVAVVSYASMSSFNNNHQVLTHLIHTFSHPITHISPLSHSLGNMDDSCSYLASSAKAGNQHKNPGGEKKGLRSLVKESISHRYVHIRGHGYMYRSINSAERVHLEPQDHHHRRWQPSRLIPGCLPTGMMPPYHLALSHPRVH